MEFLLFIYEQLIFVILNCLMSHTVPSYKMGYLKFMWKFNLVFSNRVTWTVGEMLANFTCFQEIGGLLWLLRSLLNPMFPWFQHCHAPSIILESWSVGRNRGRKADICTHPSPMSSAGPGRGRAVPSTRAPRLMEPPFSFRILKEEDVGARACLKLRPVSVLMQLITCGSLSVKDHGNAGVVQMCKPRFPNLRLLPSPLISRTMMMGELDCLSENPKLMGIKL